MGTRRAVLVAGATAMVVAALTGCSAGQVAETALKRPSNQGVNQNNSNNSVVIRNLAVVYNGPEGYQAGESASLELGLYNQTAEQVQVLISSQRPVEGGESVVYAQAVGLSGGPVSGASPVSPSASASVSPSASVSVSPSASAEPSASASAAPALTPARITLPAHGYATFLPGDKQSLQVAGLSGELRPGRSVSLTFEFSNGAEPLVMQAPVAIPLSPASRAPGIEGENHE